MSEIAKFAPGEFRHNPVLVTGGAGFIGANFIRDWLDCERTAIVNLDKLTYAGNLENFRDLPRDAPLEFVHGDIGDVDLVRNLLARIKPRAIVNFAAESHVDRSIHGPDAFINTNMVGTFRLLDSVREYWERLRGSDRDEFRFVHISTDEVYGSLAPQDAAFRETNAFSPNSPYAASKAASDHLVRAWHHTYGLPAIITNCSNNYGPFQFPEKLIPLMICHALEDKALPIYGDGMQVRDWLHVSDHCAALRVVLRNGRLGDTYNIGGWNEQTNRDVVHAICALLDEERPRRDGKSYVEQIVTVADRPGHDRRYAIDASKIKAALGWMPRETFESGLRQTVRWYLDNQEWVSRITAGSYRDWIEKNYAVR